MTTPETTFGAVFSGPPHPQREKELCKERKKKYILAKVETIKKIFIFIRRNLLICLVVPYQFSEKKKYEFPCVITN
jgi:hypothetical protein